MNLTQVKTLVEKKESKTVEFKKSTGLLHSAFATVCAFLNSKGGTVLMGVTENHQVVGQEVSDRTRIEIANEIKKIEPALSIDVEYIPVKDNKFVIAIQVKAGKHAPYVYDGRAYQRDESQTNKMSQQRYKSLILDHGQLTHPWENAVAEDYTLDDLDHEEIYKTVADGIRENRIPASAQKDDVVGILKRLELISGNKLKRAAVVLYAKEGCMKFLQCMLKMARFKGLNKLGDFIDNQQLYGNAFRLLEASDAFIKRHLPIASTFKPDQFKRIDTPALPVMAVREAMINALCHRDYSDHYTDISFAIFDDGLEIWNSGKLLQDLTTKNLKHKHKSILRNKLIANAFYVRGYIEKWGIGTNKIIDLCKDDSVPEPKFIERSGGLEVIFKFKEPIGTSSVKTKKSALHSRQAKIIEILEKYPLLNVSDILARLQIQVSLRTISADLTVLKKLGFLEQQGGGRGSTFWKIKPK